MQIQGDAFEAHDGAVAERQPHLAVRRVVAGAHAGVDSQLAAKHATRKTERSRDHVEVEIVTARFDLDDARRDARRAVQITACTFEV